MHEVSAVLVTGERESDLHQDRSISSSVTIKTKLADHEPVEVLAELGPMSEIRSSTERLGTSGDDRVHRDRIRIDGVPFDAVTMEQAVLRVIAMAKAVDRPRYVCTGNVDHLVLIDRDPEFREVYENSDLNLADGMPVVWLSRLMGKTRLPERVAGSDLFWELARVSSSHGLRLFFMGGAPESAANAARAVEKRFSGARIVGTYCPPFETFESESEQAHIREVVRAAKPDVLLVGLGAPKQEKWIAANAVALGVPVSIGVGGSFEMAAGVRRRAPIQMQQLGMEWLYRFAQEPVRLFDRYFVRDLPYLVRVLARALVNRPR